MALLTGPEFTLRTEALMRLRSAVGPSWRWAEDPGSQDVNTNYDIIRDGGPDDPEDPPYGAYGGTGTSRGYDMYMIIPVRWRQWQTLTTNFWIPQYPPQLTIYEPDEVYSKAMDVLPREATVGTVAGVEYYDHGTWVPYYFEGYMPASWDESAFWDWHDNYRENISRTDIDTVFVSSLTVTADIETLAPGQTISITGFPEFHLGWTTSYTVIADTTSTPYFYLGWWPFSDVQVPVDPVLATFTGPGMAQEATVAESTRSWSVGQQLPLLRSYVTGSNFSHTGNPYTWDFGGVEVTGGLQISNADSSWGEGAWYGFRGDHMPTRLLMAEDTTTPSWYPTGNLSGLVDNTFTRFTWSRGPR
jgi:hypothetical protein